MLRQGSRLSWWCPNRSLCTRFPQRIPHLGFVSFLLVFSAQILTVGGQCNRTNVWGREIGLAVKEEQADVIGDCAVVIALVQFHLEIRTQFVSQLCRLIFFLHLSHCKRLLVWILTVEFMASYHNTQLGRTHPGEYFV